MKKSLAIIGSTGSIGTQALDVAEICGYEIKALIANSRIDVLERQVRRFRPETVAVVDENAAKELKIRCSDLPVRVLSGASGVEECAACGADTVLNSAVGIAGLRPSLAAVREGSTLALANKESLVAGGALVMGLAAEKGVSVLPVDSEHSAIFQSLQGCRERKEVKRLILTASGGPFFGKSRAELEGVTIEQALNHPNWSMGAKITIDSATMMNKGLELIEAVWLFGVRPADIDILVHRQSVVHSLVEFCDSSVIAQLGVPDMRVPIQYALTYPMRVPGPVKQLHLEDFGSLTFEKPDYDTFTCINLCREAIEKGGLYPCIANGANEKANEMFRQGKIGFCDIADAVEHVLTAYVPGNGGTLDAVLEADRTARIYAEEFLERKGK